MNRHKYNSFQAFLDLLFCTLIGFMVMFIIAFMAMNFNKQTKNVDAKAEYIITVSWEKKSNDDVDTWLEDPEGNFIWYQRREDGLMHLDRDDIGRANDFIQTKFGRVEVKENREIVTLRGVVQGEYVLNLHMFRKDSKTPVEVNVQIDKINPYSIILIKKIKFEKDGEEKTVTRFTLNKKGEVISINDIPKSLIKRRKEPHNQEGIE